MRGRASGHREQSELRLCGKRKHSWLKEQQQDQGRDLNHEAPVAWWEPSWEKTRVVAGVWTPPDGPAVTPLLMDWERSRRFLGRGAQGSRGSTTGREGFHNSNQASENIFCKRSHSKYCRFGEGRLGRGSGGSKPGAIRKRTGVAAFQ